MTQHTRAISVTPLTSHRHNTPLSLDIRFFRRQGLMTNLSFSTSRLPPPLTCCICQHPRGSSCTGRGRGRARGGGLLAGRRTQDPRARPHPSPASAQQQVGNLIVVNDQGGVWRRDPPAGPPGALGRGRRGHLRTWHAHHTGR